MIFPNSFEIFFFPNTFVSVSYRVVCELLIAFQSACFSPELFFWGVGQVTCLCNCKDNVSAFKDIWQKAPIAHLNTQYSGYNFMSEKGFRQGDVI